MRLQYISALKEYAAALIDEWTKLVQQSSVHYLNVPLEETRKNIEQHFCAVIDVFERGDYTRLNEFTDRLAKMRNQMGFEVKETLLAFLKGQTVLFQFLDQLHRNEQSVSVKENESYCEDCREITDCFNKTLVQYANSFQEIQIEKTAQTYLREIEYKNLRLSSLTESTPDAVIGLDEQFNICSWNNAAEVMYYYSADEIIGQPFSILMPREILASGELNTIEMILRRDGVLKNYQTERIRKDGAILVVNETSTILKNNDGKVIGFSTIHRDLTELIRLEQEIRAKEHYLSSIVDNSVDAVIGLDLNSRIVSWNKGAEILFGYIPEEIINKSFEILFPPDSIESGELKRLNDELNKVGFIKNFESDRIIKSGKRITTSLTQSLLHDKDNKVIGSSAIIRDITELKKLKIQMSHSEKLSVVGQLASGIAHEVGNPLTSISSLIQVLTRQTDDENLKTNLNLVKKQTDRISKLIRDLVTFSQPSDFKIIPTDINTLITEAVEIIKYDKRAKHCEIEVHLVKKLPLTEVPADQLQQVLINLLLNALDALPSENGKISIYSFSGDGSISIKIKDNGRGIPKSIIDKIFDPFFTTKGVGKGTGLGLWVSYSIMESINGKIIVDSKETVGSTFTLEIPIIP